MSYNAFKGVTWDLLKADSNLLKHQVSFEEAATVLFSDASDTFTDDHPDEERFIKVGYSSEARILVVVYGYGLEDEFRIISARKATRKERKDYEKGI